MGYKVAIAGATGNVGREVLNILHERNFPVDELIPLASSRSVGREVSFGDSDVKVQDMAKFDFKGVDIVLSSPGGAVSAQYSPIAAAAGAVVGGGANADEPSDGAVTAPRGAGLDSVELLMSKGATVAQFRDCAAAAHGLAVACARGDVRVWDYYSGKLYALLDGPEKLAQTLKLNPSEQPQ